MAVYDWLHWLLCNPLLSNVQESMLALSESLSLRLFVSEMKGHLLNRIKTVYGCHLAWEVRALTVKHAVNKTVSTAWRDHQHHNHHYVSFTDSCCTVSVVRKGTWCSSLIQITHTVSTRAVQTQTHATINLLCPTHSLYSRVQHELLMPCVVLVFGEYQGSFRVMERVDLKGRAHTLRFPKMSHIAEVSKSLKQIAHSSLWLIALHSAHSLSSKLGPPALLWNGNHSKDW